MQKDGDVCPERPPTPVYSTPIANQNCDSGEVTLKEGEGGVGSERERGREGEGERDSALHN